jgi:hypothetical protein
MPNLIGEVFHAFRDGIDNSVARAWLRSEHRCEKHPADGSGAESDKWMIANLRTPIDGSMDMLIQSLDRVRNRLPAGFDIIPQLRRVATRGFRRHIRNGSRCFCTHRSSVAANPQRQNQKLIPEPFEMAHTLRQ